MQGHLPDGVIASLARGGQVLTANARAARALAAAWAQYAATQGMRSWRAPLLGDWESWASGIYHQLQLASEPTLPALLTPLQEQALWLRVQREEARRVVAPHRLAQLAMQANALLWQYGAREAMSEGWDPQGDARLFVGWLKAFEQECARLGAVSAARRDALVSAHLGTLSLPAEVLLLGFDRLTPAQRQVVAALEAAGVACLVHMQEAPVTSPQLLCATETRQELEQCARWVRSQLEADPARRIAVLTPQLERLRPGIDRALSRVLLPQSSRRAAESPAPWEFSLGLPLAGAPVVAAALTLLRWLAAPLDAAQITALLLGGFVAADAEEARAMQLSEAALRARGLLRAEMSLPALLSASHGILPQGVQARLASLHRWFQAARPHAHDHAAWAAITAEALERAGWPGRIERGSPIFQAQEAWNRLLDQSAMLSMLANPVGWGDYLDTLRSAAAQQLFSEESIQAPVQIMGIAESSGQTFDAVWTLGLTEDRWPARGGLHPLLPPALQRAHGMPHSDLRADAELAETQLLRVAAAAPVTVWSYAETDAGAQQRPTPLLRVVAPHAELLKGGVPMPREPRATLCVAEDLRGAPWPLEQTAGGSDVLKRQAACGFQSFAHTRLRVARRDEADWGLDAGERAVLLHAALEHLWSAAPLEPGTHRLHTSADLHHMVDAGLMEECVADAVAHALRRARQQAQGDAWALRWLELEAARMQTRLLFWIECELARAPFHIFALEKKIADAEIAGLRLNLRLDRADMLGDGSIFLIDYKTGSDVHVNQWQGERPDEPQLPIYALYGGLPHVSGIAFAQIRAGAKMTGLHALAADRAQVWAAPAGSATKPELTSAMRAEWDTALRTLAQQFLRGEAAVDPRHGDRTCDRCGMHALCRIRSQAYRPAPDENTEQSDG